MKKTDNISTYPILRMLREGIIIPEQGHFYQGDCLIVSDTSYVSSEKNKELFRSPTRMDGLILLLCAEGEMSITCNLHQIHLTPGMVFFARSGTIIQVEDVKDSRVSVVICNEDFLEKINISFQDLLPHIASLNNLYCFSLTDEQFNLLQRQISLLGDFISQPSDLLHYHEIVRSTGRTLFYHFCSLLINYLKSIRQQGIEIKTPHEEIVFRHFIQLVGQHYRKERRVSFYAEQMHLTPKYMSIVIRRASGHGPTEWINQNVLLEAKNLLRYTNMSIQEVTYNLSFPNQSFFGRWFKNQTGISPKKYRQAR